VLRLAQGIPLICSFFNLVHCSVPFTCICLRKWQFLPLLLLSAPAAVAAAEAVAVMGFSMVVQANTENHALARVLVERRRILQFACSVQPKDPFAFVP